MGRLFCFPSPRLLFSPRLLPLHLPLTPRFLSTMADVEAAKRTAAKTAVAKHYPKDARWVGIGSGTTIIYVVEAIKALGVDTSLTRYVPTGYQSRRLIVSAGLTAVEFDAVPEGTVLDVAFDGADEVDDELNCIKGGGACLFQEKLVAMQAKEFICVAGARFFLIKEVEASPTDLLTSQTRANSCLVSLPVGNTFPSRLLLSPPTVSCAS